MMQIIALLLSSLVWMASLSHGSIVYPHGTNFQGRRIGKARRRSKRDDGEFHIRSRSGRIPTTSCFLGISPARLAFSPSQAGTCLSLASALVYIGHQIQSESVKRAMYFWFHAGPIVLHYKFTRWYLSRSRAPLQKRDRVYNALHDRYCQRSLDIALHLKGLYVKVSRLLTFFPWMHWP